MNSPHPDTSFARPNRLRIIGDQPRYTSDWLTAHGIRGVNYGSGRRQLITHWLNADRQVLRDVANAATQRGQVAAFERDGATFHYLQHDAIEVLPFADASLDRVRSEHFIEHISAPLAVCWLGEVRRVLKPGGLLRLSTPDLGLYAVALAEGRQDFFRTRAAHLQRTALPARLGLERIPQRPAWLINSLFYLWRHAWLYDFDELVHAGSEAGFARQDIRRCSFRHGADARIATLDGPGREHESLYVEMRRAS